MRLHVLWEDTHTDTHAKDTDDHNRALQTRNGTGNQRGKASRRRRPRLTSGQDPAEQGSRGGQVLGVACQETQAPEPGASSGLPSLSANRDRFRGLAGYFTGCSSTDMCLTFSSQLDQGCGPRAGGQCRCHPVTLPTHHAAPALMGGQHLPSFSGKAVCHLNTPNGHGREARLGSINAYDFRYLNFL